MRIFISSLISGMEPERAAAKQAIELLRHQAVMAEDFGAQVNSPQVACLSGLRQSELVVLVLGPRYGSKQASGLSATHEEYRDARGRKAILAFVEKGVPEPEQANFIREVGEWEQGRLWAGFSTPAELRDLVTRALHDYALVHASAPLDPSALVRRARELLPETDHGRSSGTALHLAISMGPETDVLRPAELEARGLSEVMEQRALFGETAIFDRRVGTESGLQGNSLVVYQEKSYDTRREIRLWASGDMRIILPARDEDRGMGFPVVIQEVVSAKLASAISYASWLLGHVDSTERITHVALAAALVGEGAVGWRTREEHAASPNAGSFGGFGGDRGREKAVTLTPAHRVRGALALDATRIVEDLVALLKRRWKERE